MRSGKATPFHGVQDRAENGNLCKLGWTYCHGTMFAPRQCLYQREATGMESSDMYSNKWVQKFHLPVWAGNLPHLMGGSIVPRTETWVVFASKKYLYPKEATGMERTEMYSTSQCRNPTYFCGPPNYPLSWGQYRAKNGYLRKLGWTYRHGTVFLQHRNIYIQR